MMEAARNSSQLWWWRGEICFEVSWNDFYAFEPKTNNRVCACLHACALEPAWATASAPFKHVLGSSPLYFQRCFTPGILMPPDLQPSGRHQHMFLQGLSSEGILLGGENHRSSILKLCEFVQERYTLHASFWELSARITFLRIASLWSVKDKALVSTLQTRPRNHST